MEISRGFQFGNVHIISHSLNTIYYYYLKFQDNLTPKVTSHNIVEATPWTRGRFESEVQHVCAVVLAALICITFSLYLIIKTANFFNETDIIWVLTEKNIFSLHYLCFIFLVKRETAEFWMCIFALTMAYRFNSCWGSAESVAMCDFVRCLWTFYISLM